MATASTDAPDTLVTKLLQAVYTVSKIGLVQHAVAAGSKTQTITLQALIQSLCMQAPPASVPAPQPQPSRSGPPMPHSFNATSVPMGLHCPVKKALFAHFCKHPLPSDTKSFATVASAAVSLPQPPPSKRRKGVTAAQVVLVQISDVLGSAQSCKPARAEPRKARLW
jgi:hypothetical protein